MAPAVPAQSDYAEEDPGAPPSMQEVIDDLAMRFVVNCPAEEQESFERLLFQVEAAFWFYDDQYREIWPNTYPKMTMLDFAQAMFKHCELLTKFAPQVPKIYEAFTIFLIVVNVIWRGGQPRVSHVAQL